MGELIIKPENTFITVPKDMDVAEIRESLPRANRVEINKAIAMLFTARKSGNRGDEDAEMTAQVYAIAISDFPAYAIEAAVMAIIKGKAPNIAPTFVPSTDELCTEIERQMWLRIRREEEPQPVREIVKPDNHFSKKWETMKASVLNGALVTDELNKERG